MALNFPDSPTLNQVYTDTTAGFQYQWDGTVWKSFTPAASSQIKILDDISGSFNGSTQTFALTLLTVPYNPANAQQLRVVLGGIVQEPLVDYTVSGSDITFTTPPAALLDCSIVSLGPAVPINVVEDGSVTPAKLSTGGPAWNTGGDLNVSGVVTATAYYGDGSNLSGVVSGIELQQAGSSVGTSVTAINFSSGATLTTASAGISTITIVGGATGGGSDRIFYENDQEVTANYTISTSRNAMSAGPVGIATGIIVTIPSGSTWTIV
jgi:hypothetical protein